MSPYRDIPSGERRFRCNKIAIIGAGPSGLAAAKYCLAEDAFDSIEIFEQRSTVGGVWNYTANQRRGHDLRIPSTEPCVGLEQPIWRPKRKCGSNGSPGADSNSGRNSPGSDSSWTEELGKEAVFVSPMYEALETNIPKSLMRFSDLAFPHDAPLFPRHEQVLAYVERYAEEVRHLVAFETQVIEVKLLRSMLNPSGSEQDEWSVRTRHLPTGTERSETYNAVIIASGHYATPYIPSIPGLRSWATRSPASVTHSKYFRRPEAFKDQKVVVVGNSASGLDITAQLVHCAKKPVLLSRKSESYLAPGFASSADSVTTLPHITALDSSARTVTFENGHIERDVDAILFCTGYLYTLPFLPSNGNIPSPIVPDGSRLQHTYHHLFYTPRPTLSFLALPQKVIPFPVSEVQAAVLAHMYAGRLSLPPQEEMELWETQEDAQKGSGGGFVDFGWPRDGAYINFLSDWATSAEESERKGKRAPRWGEWEGWVRERFPRIRRAFVDLGEERYKAKTLEDVGFDFEEWKSETLKRVGDEKAKQEWKDIADVAG